MTVNFINILQAVFSYQSSLRTFYVLQFGFVIFWQKDFGAKATHKMLVKLTPGVFNFWPNCDLISALTQMIPKANCNVIVHI